MVLLSIPQALQQGGSCRADTWPGTCSCGSRALAVTPCLSQGMAAVTGSMSRCSPAPRSPSTCPSPFISSLESCSGTSESQRHMCHSTSTPSHSAAPLSIPVCSTLASCCPFQGISCWNTAGTAPPCPHLPHRGGAATEAAEP